MASTDPEVSVSLSRTCSLLVRPGRTLRLSGFAVGGCSITASSTRFLSFLSLSSWRCGGGMSESQLSIFCLSLSTSHAAPVSRSLRTMAPRLTRNFTPERTATSERFSMPPAATGAVRPQLAP